MRRILVLLGWAAVLGVVYGAVSVGHVWWVGRTDQARPVDAIVVMGVAQYDGRPSPQLESRLRHVVALWRSGVADTVITTGGKQPGDRFTESEASTRYLVAAGVPESAIVGESTGSSTRESMRGVRDILTARSASSVLIVTDPFHALRSRLIAEELGIEAYVSSTPSSLVRGRSNLRLHVREGLGVAVARIVGFERLDRLAG